MGRWILDKISSVIAANHFGEEAMGVDRLGFLNVLGYVEEAFITGLVKRAINIEVQSDR